MKAFKLLLTLSLCLFMITGHARKREEPRLDQVDKQELRKELNKGLQEFKQENNGVIDFRKLRPLLADRLSEFYEMRTVTLEELKAFELQYNQVAIKFSKADEKKKEKAIQNLFNLGFQTVENTKLKKLKQGDICNKWDCEKGLDCAMVPERLLGKFKNKKSCLGAKVQCTEDSECCSGVCELNSKGKSVVGSCQATMRCFRPVALNKDCFNSPICQNGDCLQINWNRSGINECRNVGSSCQANNDCCTNSCNKNVCVEKFLCKNCVDQGEKANRGRKCCEGLYKNQAGKCVREFPPLIIPGGAFNTRTAPAVKFFKQVMEVIFPSAHADANSDATNEAKEFIKGEKKNAEGDGFKKYFKYGYGKQEFETQRDTEKTIKAAVNKATGGGQKYSNNCAANDTKCIEEAKNRYSEGLESHMMTPQFPIGEASDFKTCRIDFKNDYLHFLKKQNLLNLEFALAGFEFVMLGQGVEDFWTTDNTSTYKRLQTIAKQHKEQRKEIFGTIVQKEDHLRCLCLDRVGYPKLKDLPKLQAKLGTTDPQEWFKENCDKQYKAYEAELAAIKQQYSDYDEDMYQGDASGIKYKMMLVEWTGALADFQAELTAINTKTFTDSHDFSKLSNGLNWNQTEVKENELYNYTVYPFSGGAPTSYSLGYSLGALLSAGIVAVVAAIGGPALITTWAAAGLIAAGAVTGGVAQWTVAALRGAWMSQPPIIEDQVLKSAYKCTKKGAMCQDYTRVLHQPVNNVCGDEMPFASNACIKHFIAVPRKPTVEEQNIIDKHKSNPKAKKYYETLYSYDLMIDPWIPWTVQKKSLIKDSKQHIDYLQSSAKNAISQMKKWGPDPYDWTVVSKFQYERCTRQSNNLSDDNNDYYWNCDGTFVQKNGKYYKKTPKSKTGNHVNVGMGYLSTTFLDGQRAGYYIPKFKTKEQTYIISEDAIKEIKTAARKYIVEEAELLTDKDIAAQNSFADYAFKYHFVWPRVSRPGTIMYPPPAFLTYLDLIAHGFGTISYGNAEANYAYRERHKDYVANLLNTLKGFNNSSSLMTNNQADSLVNKEKLEDNLKKKLKYLNNTSAGFKSAMKGNTVPLTNGSILNGQQLSKADANAMNAINRLNKIRKEQKKAAEHYKKATASSETARKLAAAQKSTISNFFTPAAGDKGHGSFSSFSNNLGKANFDSKTKDDNAAIQEANKLDFKRPNMPNLNKQRSLGYGDDSSDILADINSSNTIKGDDAQKVASAMDAMEKSDKIIEQANGGQSLFDIVTKAYFRSYKRIFSPKRVEIEEAP